MNITHTEESWGMYVNSIGYPKVAPAAQYPAEKHPESHHLTWNRGRILDDYYIVFISSGKGIFASALTPETNVHEGSCFFLFPGVKHRYKPDVRSGWEEYWVGFNGLYAKQLMSQDFFSETEPLVKIGPNKEILLLFRNILETVKNSLPGYPQQIAGLSLQLLGHVNTISSSLGYSENPIGKLISKATFIIHESFENALDMEALARQLPMGYAAFRKSFKLVTGESPNQYHLNLRLNRAKDLLNSTILNISEIATQTGFDSVFYFSRLFKKKHGVSPKSYRAQNN
ncbi:helix-turn-helix domain-containing protein [Pedobacter sp. UYEF25]